MAYKNTIDLITERVYRKVLNEMFYEDSDDSEYDDYDDDDDDKESDSSKDDDSDDDNEYSAKDKKLLKKILGPLEQTFDDDLGSYNLTRSQLSYQLWPDLDHDTARSKMSQKIEGKKRWKSWEINRLYNIFSGRLG